MSHKLRLAEQPHLKCCSTRGHGQQAGPVSDGDESRIEEDNQNVGRGGAGGGEWRERGEGWVSPYLAPSQCFDYEAMSNVLVKDVAENMEDLVHSRQTAVRIFFLSF